MPVDFVTLIPAIKELGFPIAIGAALLVYFFWPLFIVAWAIFLVRMKTEKRRALYDKVARSRVNKTRLPLP